MCASRPRSHHSTQSNPTATRVQLAFNTDPAPHHCGYCDTYGNCSVGFVSPIMLVDDYQHLMDRGWRKNVVQLFRCGNYYYKSLMKKTCCPLYTIRCDVNNFHISSSQRRVVQTMNQFINYNIKPKPRSGNRSSSDLTTNSSVQSNRNPAGQEKSIKNITVKDWLENGPSTRARDILHRFLTNDLPISEDSLKEIHGRQKRWYNKLNKLRSKEQLTGQTEIHRLIKRFHRMDHSSFRSSLEDLLKFNETTENKFELRLVRSYPPSEQYRKTLVDSHGVYKRYQMAIHGDDEDDCSFSQFERFLGQSTLHDSSSQSSSRPTPSCGYGSFHLQYYLNEKIIACSVIDILPGGISSVYFYYEPDLKFLKLGVYSALREIELNRRLSKEVSNMKYYYLGFYIHSCVKMRYKGQYTPSYLLCPEAYTWNPIEKCRSILDVKKYSRLEPDPAKVDQEEENNVENLKLRVHENLMAPSGLRRINQSYYNYFLDRFVMFAKFVGRTCASRIIIDLN